MKDYTKYDFAAIVGAEVETTQKDGRKSSGTLKAIGRQNGAILLYPSDEKKLVDWVLIKDILSLTAKIKVEDMTAKQLKRFANIQGELSGILDVVIRFKEKRIEIFAGWDEKRCVHLFSEQHGLDDYIDCTDWGWKHE